MRKRTVAKSKKMIHPFPVTFSDTSEASQNKSREGYRSRAHIRKAKAAERREKRALARRPFDSRVTEIFSREMKEPFGDE